MTNNTEYAPMLSVERELIERAVQAIINTSQMQPALNELRALLDKPESFDLEDPHVVGYMPDHPDGDPLITLEDHRNYVAALLARQTFASNLYPVGCRYRKIDRPDRCWTYCEGVKVTPWKGWEVQPLFTGQQQGEPVVMIPEFLDMPPFSTINRGSKNYKAGYNAALRKVAEMNGLSHDQT